MELKLLNGDCLDKLKELDNDSVDSIVTDPPYGLSFMGKKWDYDVPSVEIWEECMRVLKPGGHLLAFAGSRTYHRMAVRIEDAGFEIRDQIMWIYGSGFPKSHNVGNAIDKKNGAGNRGHAISSGNKFHPTTGEARPNGEQLDKYKARTEEGKGWEGWGTALKPAHEPIVLARKPLIGTVAENTLQYGVGGLNIDGCRVGNEERTVPVYSDDVKDDTTLFGLHPTIQHERVETTQGRWPANIILECTCENPKVVADKYDIRTYNNYKNTFQSYEENDSVKGEYKIKDVETKAVIHTDPNCPCYILDKQSGETGNGWKKNYGATDYNGKQYDSSTNQCVFGGGYNGKNTYADKGGASRFFYCPKANAKDRNEGMPEKVPQFTGRPRREDGSVIYKETHPEEWNEAMSKKPRKEKTSLAASEEILQPTTKGTMNTHPTVKPTDLMQYLIRLVTPKGGIVLDPFMGSGSTGKAAIKEGMSFIGIEREKEYFEIAKQRVKIPKINQFFE